ncbi:MAG: hypothetical protein GF317_09895 [Candidatus Lokiarchaeota archaeon]|nr:hypothetical protein [Candidatus Lokiarchaeota archaeon]
MIQIVLFSIIFIITFIIIYLAYIKKKIRLKLRDQQIIIITLGSCILISILFNIYFLDFITDDAFISFRYSKNLANGYGIVFNPNTDNPVEGYSNFLWVVLNAIPILLNIDIVIWFKIFSIILNIFSIIYLYRLGTRFYSDKVALFCPLLYVLYYPIQLWVVGGLEVPLLLSSMIIALYFMFKEMNEKNRFPRYSWIFFSINILTRIDSIIFVVGIEGISILYYLYKKDKSILLQRIISLIIIGTIFSVYFIWRYSFYGYFFPNPYYAKAGTNNLITQEGLQYVLLFGVFTFPILIMLVFSIIKILRSREEKLLKMLLIMVIPIIINVSIVLHLEKHYAGQGFRFLLPSMPFLILISCYSFEVLAKNKDLRLNLSISSINLYLNKFIPLFACFCLILYPLTAPLIYVNTTNTDVNNKYYKLANWLKNYNPSNTTVAFTDMGIIPYYSELYYIDLWGLNDEVLAKNRGNYDYILDQEPEFIFIKENNLKIIKNITNQQKFQDNYSIFFTLELKEINQNLRVFNYNLFIYKINEYSLTNTSLINIFL